MARSSKTVLVWICICLLAVAANEFTSTTEDSGTSRENEDPPVSDKKPISVLMLNGILMGHLFPLVSLGEELVKRGHNITLCSTVIEGSKLHPANISEPSGIKFLSAGTDKTTQQDFEELSKGLSNSSPSKMIDTLYRAGYNIVQVRQALDAMDMDQFDIIVCDLSVAQVGMYQAVLGNKVIAYASFIPPYQTIEPPWPIPPTFTIGYQSFFERLVYAVMIPLLLPLRDVLFVTMMNQVDDRFNEVLGGIDFMRYPGINVPIIMTTVIGYDVPNLLTPLKHYVGPVLKGNLTPLGEELRDWLDGKQEREVIYISFGTTGFISDDFMGRLIDGILGTRYNAIWALREESRYLSERITDEDRFLVQGWIPQQTLLRHPAIALTIHHCGLNTVQESLYNGLPVVCLPHAFDQFQVGGTVQTIEVGVSMYSYLNVVLGNKNFSAEDMTNAITKATSDKYVENAKRLSLIYKFAGGAKRAADLVEFYEDVGYDHLIPAFAKYNWSWVQYYNVDVYAILIGLCGIVLFVLCKCCLCVCRSPCRGKASGGKAKVE